MYIDIVFGDVNVDQHVGKSDAINELANKIKELTNNVKTARLELGYQRSREEEFRDSSERVNSKVVKWTLFQIAVLGWIIIFLLILVGTCFWQMRHLKGFFVAKKLL